MRTLRNTNRACFEYHQMYEASVPWPAFCPFPWISFSNLLPGAVLWPFLPCPGCSFSPTPSLEPAQGFTQHVSLSCTIELKLICFISSFKLCVVHSEEVFNFISTVMHMSNDTTYMTQLRECTRICTSS